MLVAGVGLPSYRSETDVEWIQSTAKLIQDGGWLVVLLIILATSYKEIWVWGARLRTAETERDQWKAIALQLAGINEKALDVAQATTQQERARL